MIPLSAKPGRSGVPCMMNPIGVPVAPIGVGVARSLRPGVRSGMYPLGGGSTLYPGGNNASSSSSDKGLKSFPFPFQL